MKRLAIALSALVCMAIFISPASADDRVSLSGSFHIYAWDDTHANGADDANYIQQRFRVQTTINIADDVKAVMRADYGDGTWGSDYTTSYNNGLVTRPNRGSSSAIDIDRGYVQIDKPMWQLTAGQQFVGLGIYEVLDAQITGLKLVLKLPVKTSFIYGKASENGSLNDDGDNGDRDLYAVNFSYDADAFSSNLFAGTVVDGSAVDDSPTMFGFNVSGSLGIVNLTSELAFATGDTADGTIDYVGTQFYLEANANLSDAFSLGAQLLYALGTDDADEQQLTYLSDWWTFTPTSHGTPLDTWWDASSEFNGGNTNPFDPTGSNGGVKGITLFARYNVMSDMSLGGQVGYFEPEEDANTNIDSITTFNAWASYKLATNTALALTYFYSTFDDNTLADEDYKSLAASLEVSF